MGVTPGGLPWPDGTELVAGGDDAIKALADAVDPHGATVARTTTGSPSTAGWQAMSFTATSARRGAATGNSAGITVTKTGIYLVSGYVEWGALASGPIIGACLAVGGVKQVGPGQSGSIHSGTRPIYSFAGFVALSAGAVVGMQIYNVTTGVQFTGAVLSAYLISAGSIATATTQPADDDPVP